MVWATDLPSEAQTQQAASCLWTSGLAVHSALITYSLSHHSGPRGQILSPGRGLGRGSHCLSLSHSPAKYPVLFPSHYLSWLEIILFIYEQSACPHWNASPTRAGALSYLQLCPWGRAVCGICKASASVWGGDDWIGRVRRWMVWRHEREVGRGWSLRRQEPRGWILAGREEPLLLGHSPEGVWDGGRWGWIPWGRNRTTFKYLSHIKENRIEIINTIERINRNKNPAILSMARLWENEYCWDRNWYNFFGTAV